MGTEPPHAQDQECSDLEYVEICKWTRSRIQARLTELEQLAAVQDLRVTVGCGTED